jgi:hypothetical protein
MPWLDRNCESSVSFSVFTYIWSDRLVNVCHSPSLRILKNFSIGKGLLSSI